MSRGFGSHYSIRLSYGRVAGHYVIEVRHGLSPRVAPGLWAGSQGPESGVLVACSRA